MASARVGNVIGHAGDRAQLAQELGRGAVVVRHPLERGGAVVALEPLGEPLSERRVAARPLALREGAVRDVAHDLRGEHELVAAQLEQLALGEPVEGSRRVDGVAALLAERAHGLDRPAGADDRAVLEHVALCGVDGVESRRDEPLERRGELPRAGRGRGPRLADQRGELFDEERVATTALVQHAHELRRGVVAEQLDDERPHRVEAQRLEVQHGEVVTARGRGPAVVQLGTGGRDKHERTTSEPLEHAVQQAEDEIVGPVHVGEDEHQRSLRGDVAVQRAR